MKPRRIECEPERDYWDAVTDVPCPCGGGMIRWAEAGYVPGWRQCDGCGTHWRAEGNAKAPVLVEQDYPRDRGPYARMGTQVEAIATVCPDALSLGVDGPGGRYKPDASPTKERCALCGAPAMWIAGAGEALCVRHQDDY